MAATLWPRRASAPPRRQVPSRRLGELSRAAFDLSSGPWLAAVRRDGETQLDPTNL